MTGDIDAQVQPSSFEQARRLISMAQPLRLRAATFTSHQSTPPAQAGPSMIVTDDAGPACPITGPMYGSDRITRRLSCSTWVSIPMENLSEVQVSLLLFCVDEGTVVGVACEINGFILQATEGLGQGRIHCSDSLPPTVHPCKPPSTASTSHQEKPSAHNGPSMIFTPSPGYT